LPMWVVRGCFLRLGLGVLREAAFQGFHQIDDFGCSAIARPRGAELIEADALCLVGDR
jgi:hypothetical protein